MTNYKVLESSQRRIYTVMGFKDIFLRPQSAEEFNEQVVKDSMRNDFLVDPGQNLDDLRRKVFKTRANGGYFSQSDYEGGSFLTALYSGTNFMNKLVADRGYIAKGSFGYEDREGHVCGLTIYRIKEDPAKYAFSFVRNADAAILEDRETTIIYDDNLLDILGLEPFDTSLEAKYPEGATPAENSAASLNELTESEVSSQGLKGYLSALLNSDTAEQIVGALFVSADELNPDAIEHISEIIFLYRFLDIVEIPAADEENFIQSFGRDISYARLKIQDEARNNPTEFFAKHNFKSHLISIIHQAAPEQRQKLELEYIKYCAKDYGLLDSPLMQRLDGSEPIANVILKAINDGLNAFNDGNNLSIRDINSYYLLYLASLAISASSRSERKIIFKKIEQVADNLDEENQEISEVASVQTDIEAALEIARNSDKQLNFDPQGRLLIDTGNSIVSVDISGYPDLQAQYNQQIKDLLLKREGIDDGIASTIIESLNELKSKNSIIFLQQEMHFHLMLALRLYEGQYPGGSFNDFADIHAETMDQINESVMQAFVEGLVQASATGKQRDINKALSAARASIIADAHDKLLDNLLKRHPDYDLSKYNPDATAKNAKHTTATVKRVLHQDRNLATVTEIEGSEVTSHYRATGTKFAHRGIRRYRYDPKNGVTYLLSGNKVRSPSLPVKTGLSEQEYIDDTVVKIKELVKEYNFKKPFTYNLLTAMNDVIGDGFTNKQTQSAKHIILGAHAYNRQVLAKSGANNYCLIQAISVNGYGRPLEYRRFGTFARPLADEATLLTEMALYHNLDGDADSFSKYEAFLKQPEPASGIFGRIASLFTGRTKYFVKTPAGQELKAEIAEKKLAWKNVQNVDSDDYVALAKASLQKIMGHDLHYSHDYAKLIQALSLFIEEDAVFGCKSGNERTPIIDERVQIIEQPQLPEYLVHAFVSLSKAQDKQAAQAAARNLKAALDKCYNEENVYGSTAMIPLMDQGAGHKISPAKTLTLNRNSAEESTIDNLVQSNVREMQAHNDLPTFMNQAVERRKKLGNNLQVGHDDSGIKHGTSYAAVTQGLGGLDKVRKSREDIYTEIPREIRYERSTTVLDSDSDESSSVSKEDEKRPTSEPPSPKPPGMI